LDWRPPAGRHRSDGLRDEHGGRLEGFKEFYELGLIDGCRA